MGIVDGQAVDAANSNPAWLAAIVDDTALGIIGFANVAAVSGAAIVNTQALQNANRLATGADETDDTVARTYSSAPGPVPTGTLTDLEDHRVSLINLAKKYFGTSGGGGHVHDGTDGEGAKIESVNLSSVPLSGVFVNAADLSTITGTSTVVTTELTGKSPSTGQTVLGVVVNAPNNKAILRHAAGGAQENTPIEDVDGDQVFGRVTEAAGVWTLTYFADKSGVETSHNFTGATDIRWYYQELYNSMDPAQWPVYSELAIIPSDNAAQDVPTATTTVQGKTQLATTAGADVTTAGAAGTANGTVANADHAHKGAFTVKKSGDTDIHGTITMSEGANITLTQVGNDISVAASGGGGGGAGAAWNPDPGGAPLDDVENGEQVWLYDNSPEDPPQLLNLTVKVPDTYVAGTQINMKVGTYTASTTNTHKVEATTTLIRTGTDAISSTTNQHASTNAGIANAAPADRLNLTTIDLTDGSGEINAVAVSAGDVLKIALERDTTDSDTAQIRFIPSLTEVSFS
jgi:hypothetical protein